MSRKRSATHPAAGSPRPARRIHEEVPGKLPEIAECPDCRASYRNGRWTWKPAPAGSYESLCPACQRIDTDDPAGILRVEGEFAAAHREEIIGLIRNLEERERTEHPLKRIMNIANEGDGFVVTTTDAKLLGTFGRSLEKAYGGQLEHSTTSETEGFLRARWTRS